MYFTHYYFFLLLDYDCKLVFMVRIFSAVVIFTLN